MRIALIVSVLACACAAARAEERFSGFLTFGCGDSYIKTSDVSETWFVELPPRRQEQLFELANLYHGEHNAWWTLQVEVEGRVQVKARRGFFFDHPKKLIITRTIAARYPEVGESVRAATAPAKRYRGYLVLGDESAGFAPMEQGNELWWVSAGKVRWEQVNKLIPPSTEQLYGALVEIVGQVGPPGAFGHLQSYNREIVMDEIAYLRRAAMDELTSTAAVGAFGRAADIEKCRPQR